MKKMFALIAVAAFLVTNAIGTPSFDAGKGKVPQKELCINEAVTAFSITGVESVCYTPCVSEVCFTSSGVSTVIYTVVADEILYADTSPIRQGYVSDLTYHLKRGNSKNLFINTLYGSCRIDEQYITNLSLNKYFC